MRVSRQSYFLNEEISHAQKAQKVQKAQNAQKAQKAQNGNKRLSLRCFLSA